MVRTVQQFNNTHHIVVASNAMTILHLVYTYGYLKRGLPVWLIV